MSEQPLPKFDPERLKSERANVDLGETDETGHDHATHGTAIRGGNASEPAIGSTPPPR